jgi:hypothetical protein
MVMVRVVLNGLLLFNALSYSPQCAVGLTARTCQRCARLRWIRLRACVGVKGECRTLNYRKLSAGRGSMLHFISE